MGANNLHHDIIFILYFIEIQHHETHPLNQLHIYTPELWDRT